MRKILLLIITVFCIIIVGCNKAGSEGEFNDAFIERRKQNEHNCCRYR